MEMKNYVSRAVTLERAKLNDNERIVPVTLATDTPAIVMDWSQWELIREILIPDGVMMPQNNQLVMLNNHTMRGDVKQVVKGSLRNLRVENNRLEADAHFSSLANEEYTLVQEGHLTDISVGYQVYNEHTVIIKAGATANINGKMYENNYKDNLDMYIRTKWSPLEGSLVPVGADSLSKFKREDINQEIFNKIAETEKKISEIEHRNLQINIKESKKMDEIMNVDEVRKAERERINNIETISKRFHGRINNINDLERTAKMDGWTVDRFNGAIVDQLQNGEVFQKPIEDLDLSKKDRENYNLFNLIRSVVKNDSSIGAHEREISKEIAKRAGMNLEHNSFAIDFGVLSQRAISLSGASALIPTQHMPGSFLDLLYNKMVFGKFLNVKMLTGLVGKLSFPRKASGTTAGYKGEAAAYANGDLTFGSDVLEAKKLTASVTLNEEVFDQVTPDIQTIIYNDLLNACQVKADEAFIHGSGSTANEPLGILGITGVQTSEGASIDYDKLVDMEGKLRTANIDMNLVKYLAAGNVQTILEKRKIETGQIERLWNNDKVKGRPALDTGQVQDDHLIAIDPSEIIIGNWGTVVMQIDLSRISYGQTTLLLKLQNDIINRRPVGTVYADNVS